MISHIQQEDRPCDATPCIQPNVQNSNNSPIRTSMPLLEPGPSNVLVLKLVSMPIAKRYVRRSTARNALYAVIT